ncbi:hypothetical protein [Arthrobacter sp. cf158]|uniref:hypothetical protein n=1 Tax=Arthrobacter sp. cf158 TaxID=1761744 RepID=UPI000B85DAE2|nr:hypothetical protein [Arthrobacter sp. cf158]
MLNLRRALRFVDLTGNIFQRMDQLGPGRPFRGNILTETVREHAPEFRESSSRGEFPFASLILQRTRCVSTCGDQAISSMSVEFHKNSIE